MYTLDWPRWPDLGPTASYPPVGAALPPHALSVFGQLIRSFAFAHLQRLFRGSVCDNLVSGRTKVALVGLLPNKSFLLLDTSWDGYVMPPNSLHLKPTAKAKLTLSDKWHTDLGIMFSHGQNSCTECNSATNAILLPSVFEQTRGLLAFLYFDKLLHSYGKSIHFYNGKYNLFYFSNPRSKPRASRINFCR